jgi:dienelactone hydrolase
VIIFMGGSPGLFHRKADQAGFVVVGASSSGNSTGNPSKGWLAGDPRVSGFEDIDYIAEVIRRVKASENCNDAFTVGLSAGGHMSLAYACARPGTIKAACSLDEFMGLTTNIPSAPLPIIMFHGTSDGAVPYTMAKDTIDRWREVDGLLNATPFTSYPSSPLIPGRVSETTWRGGRDGNQVAFVTIVGGTHTYPTPVIETGYDFTDGLWAFFSRFLTSSQDSPRIVSQPMDNVQLAGQPATFEVVATGRGPLRYQWQKNGVDIEGATADYFTAVADTGATFRAVVKNDSGTVTSAAATLTVNAPPADPAIVAQPADQTAIAGHGVSFTVAAKGSGEFSYQWKKNGFDITGATGPSLAMPAAILPDCGATFTVIVTDKTGSVESQRATLTVTPAAGSPVILVHPVRARVPAGEKATFSVSARSASPMKYQWQKGRWNGNMTDIPGATGSIYTTPTVTPGDNRTLFRCVISNSEGNVTSASEMLLIPAR